MLYKRFVTIILIALVGTVQTGCFRAEGGDACTEHVYDMGSVYKAPACEKEGVKVYTCIRCGEKKSESIAPTGHRYGEGVRTKEPTCASAGEIRYVCKQCGSVKAEAIAKSDAHRYDGGIAVKEATCAEKGERRYTCAVCGATKTEETDRTGAHRFAAWKVERAPSCTLPGAEKRVCSDCGKKETRAVGEATGHEYGEELITDTAASCTADGTGHYICKKCGVASPPEQLAKVPHQYGEELITDTAASCTADGTGHYICKKCGVASPPKQLAKVPHQYGEPIVVPPGRTTDGSSTVRCKNCSDRVVTVLPANPDLPMSAAELVRDLGAGWNLGNALDAFTFGPNREDQIASADAYADRTVTAGDLTKPENEYVFLSEQAWNNPVITRELIGAVKARGFRSVRLPVTWYDHIDKNDKIDPVFMARVKQVAGYILDEGMYCIVNLHHDGLYASGGWLTVNEECPSCPVTVEGGEFVPCAHERARFDKATKRFLSLWAQIASSFRLCGEKLLFASMNEVSGFTAGYTIGADNNSAASAAVFRYCLENVNILNRKFVSLIRSAGDYNADRFLIAPTYYTVGYDSVAAQAFELPQDEKNAVIAEIHSYSPWNFVGEAEGGVLEWQSGTGGYDTARMLDDTFKMIKSYFLDRNIPVMIGEWGSCNLSDRLKGDAFAKRQTDRALHAQYFSEKAKEMGLAAFLWDDGGESRYRLIDRNTYEWAYLGVTDAVVNAYNQIGQSK